MRQFFTFDIFDTLITRRVARPVDAFLLLGQRLKDRRLITSEPVEFVRNRVDAEMRSRYGQPSGETDLPRIYRFFPDSIIEHPDFARSAQEEEMAVELELVAPVEANLQLLETTWKSGEAVACLSDMYLDESFIRKLLKKVGNRCLEVPLFVSNRHQASKRSGLLFAKVRDLNKIRYRDWHHFGDDEIADFRIPKRLGIRAKLTHAAKLNRYEMAWMSNAERRAEYSALEAGTARAVRVSKQFNDPHHQTIHEIGASVVAPVLVSFVRWILQRAVEKKLGRLYFVSRDGQILLRIAKILATGMTDVPELRYLYVSRHVLHLGALRHLDESAFEWLFDQSSFLSLECLFKRLNLSPAIVSEPLIDLGYPEDQWRRNLTAAERDQVKERIFRNPELVREMEAKLQTPSTRVRGYLQQEKMFDDIPCGVVDLGWHGTMFRSLIELLPESVVDLKSFFLFSFLSNRMGRHADRLETFCGDCRILDVAPIPEGAGSGLETFCQADHGLVIDYLCENGLWVPVTASENNRRVFDWGYGVVANAVEQFTYANFIQPRRDDVEDWQAIRASSRGLLEMFWKAPSFAEATAWGDFPFETDQTGFYTERLASPLTIGQVVRNLGRVPQGTGWWQLGVLTRSGRTAATLQRILRMLRTAGSRVIRLVREN